MALFGWSRDEAEAFKTAVQQLTEASGRNSEAAATAAPGAVPPVGGAVTFSNTSPLWRVVRLLFVVALMITAAVIAVLALFDFSAVGSISQLNRTAVRAFSVDEWLVAGLVVAFLLAALVFGMGYGQVELKFSLGAEETSNVVGVQYVGGPAESATESSTTTQASTDRETEAVAPEQPEERAAQDDADPEPNVEPEEAVAATASS